MSKSKLLSGRVVVTNPKEVSEDRYQFLDLSQAEPNLGVPNFSASLSGSPAIVVSDDQGNRGFVRSLDLDRVSGSFTGSFKGDATDLFNLPAATFIASGSSTASFVNGLLLVNTDTIVLGNLYVSESIIAEQLIVNLISSSVIYSSGSNIFGDEITDKQQFTGSVELLNNLSVGGNVSASMFTGSGAGLFDIPRSAFSGDAFRIASGSVTASVSPDFGFKVESQSSGSQFTGSVNILGNVSASMFTGSGAGLFDIPRSALTPDALVATIIATGSVTASTDAQRGFVVKSAASGSEFTGSIEISGSVTLASGSIYSGSGAGLFDIPRSALTPDALLSTLLTTGSVTASVTPQFGFKVESSQSGSQFTGSLFVSGARGIELTSGSSYSGSGARLFDIPLTALTQEAQDAINAVDATKIASGSVTASVSDRNGFLVVSVASGSTFSGSIFLSSGSQFSGSGAGLFDIPRAALSPDALLSTLISSGSVTASVSPNNGFIVTSVISGSQFTGSLFVSGGISINSGSKYSGSGANLFDIPLTALTQEAQDALTAVDATKIFSGSVTASTDNERGFVVTSIASGSTFSGSVFLSSGSIFSGSGAGLFDIPRTALAPDALV